MWPLILECNGIGGGDWRGRQGTLKPEEGAGTGGEAVGLPWPGLPGGSIAEPGDEGIQLHGAGGCDWLLACPCP
ncbi:MAG: hypothetical protein RI897_2161 [Verrucomicrobiota bacterium]